MARPARVTIASNCDKFLQRRHRNYILYAGQFEIASRMSGDALGCRTVVATKPAAFMNDDMQNRPMHLAIDRCPALAQLRRERLCGCLSRYFSARCPPSILDAPCWSVHSRD